ncbi:MAG: hypothetical protein GY749_19760 [Desulfobacteraceae bacterium]|nr:hypothetical protein [Desulfobacteraceae bacterium]
MRLTIILTVALLLMGMVLQANAAPQLTLGSPIIMQGGTGSLTLSISDGTEPYAGANAKILLPDGIAVTGVSEGDLLEGFTTDYYQLSNSNEVTVIAYSRDKTFNSGGVLLTLDLEADDNAEVKIHDVKFESVNSNSFINSKYALSNASGTSVEPSTGDGKITVFQASSEDTDNDGLSDSWETQYFGNLDKTGTGDYDNDGFTNAQEYENGTDPTVPDKGKKINLSDAVLVLKVVCGMKPAGINIGADINKDGKIGLQEAVFIIQKVSELRK